MNLDWWLKMSSTSSSVSTTIEISTVEPTKMAGENADVHACTMEPTNPSGNDSEDDSEYQLSTSESSSDTVSDNGDLKEYESGDNTDNNEGDEEGEEEIRLQSDASEGEECS